MIFRRRDPAPWRERLRVALWPRHSWSRSAAYVSKRVLRLNASPHSIAAGVAAGVFASFTPFMGFHFIIAFAVAYLFAGNMIAAALGTAVGNPVTFPAIWAASYWVGSYLLAGGVEPSAIPEAMTVSFSSDSFLPVETPGAGAGFNLMGPMLKPMVLGGVLLGSVAALMFYFPTRKFVASFQEARARRIAAAARRA